VRETGPREITHTGSRTREIPGPCTAIMFMMFRHLLCSPEVRREGKS
jgi:hypothetical protein